VSKDTKRKAISNILLIGISMIMVIGFFYHGTFYQIGLIPLVIIGGIAVFIVLKIISWANSSLSVKRKGRVGTLLFRADQIPSILYGEISTTVRPLKKGRLKVDMLCTVKATLSGKPAGMVLIKDVRRRRLNELSDKEIKDEGVSSSLFKQEFMKRYGGTEDQIVRVIHFISV
jgi:hypothetical protein